MMKRHNGQSFNCKACHMRSVSKSKNTVKSLLEGIFRNKFWRNRIKIKSNKSENRSYSYASIIVRNRVCHDNE